MEPIDLPSIPPAWESYLAVAWDAARRGPLGAFLRNEYAGHSVYPPAGQVFTALSLTPPDHVKVVIVGQDPYHGEGQAHGLAFSVRPGVRPPASLVNIFKELKADVGVTPPKGSGDLSAWAKQGVLLLNTALTVRAAEPLSHRGKGWEPFTDAILQAVSAGKHRVVFVLWGGHAQKKLPLIDTSRHGVIQSAHPSPLSARNGFFGSRPFSQANALLKEFGRPEVDWRLG